jgi:hypothetical protein
MSASLIYTEKRWSVHNNSFFPLVGTIYMCSWFFLIDTLPASIRAHDKAKAGVDGSETQLRAVIVASMPTTYICQFSKLSFSSFYMTSFQILFFSDPVFFFFFFLKKNYYYYIYMLQFVKT